MNEATGTFRTMRKWTIASALLLVCLLSFVPDQGVIPILVSAILIYLLKCASITSCITLIAMVEVFIFGAWREIWMRFELCCEDLRYCFDIYIYIFFESRVSVFRS